MTRAGSNGDRHAPEGASETRDDITHFDRQQLRCRPAAVHLQRNPVLLPNLVNYPGSTSLARYRQGTLFHGSGTLFKPTRGVFVTL
jgi:hypothetical protein